VRFFHFLNLSSNFEFGPVGNRPERSGPVGPVPTVSGLVRTGSVNPAPVRPDHWSVGASETDVVCISSQGTRRFSFFGSIRATVCINFSTTTTTPDFLQRLLCYDNDDTMVDPMSSNAARNAWYYLYLSS
jgi:hypothetical protein